MVQVLAFVMPVELTGGKLCHPVNKGTVRILVQDGHGITLLHTEDPVIGVQLVYIVQRIHDSGVTSTRA